MIIVYSPRYHIDLGNHVYPTTKYHLIYAELIRRGLASAADLVEPEPASWDDLALVHDGGYLTRVRNGSLSSEEIRMLELPLSQGIVDGFRLMTGGTVAAARLLFERTEPLVMHLGGGFHHAFPGHGEGFCLFNDIAVAIRRLQYDHHIVRAAVVDCDVHQGNGTAFIFERDSSVFTFSMHQQHNYPAFKPRGSLDIGLADGTNDDDYLRALEGALPRILASSPEVVFYLAGADPYRDDQLGGLGLTVGGLRSRDRLVFDAMASAGVPVVVTLAGGYARDVADTVDIHLSTVEVAAGMVDSHRPS